MVIVLSVSDTGLESFEMASVLKELTVIIAEQPDWVLIQGDTTTVTAASLVAFYHKIKICNTKAGLRTGDKYHPFPEEINRKVANAVCDLYFLPREKEKRNLLQEGTLEESIQLTGNIVIDALLDVESPPFNMDEASRHHIPWSNRYAILAAAHRRESLGELLKNSCQALLTTAELYIRIVRFVYLVHLNPNVQRVGRRFLGCNKNISFVLALDYQSFVDLMRRSHLILTNYGSIQEEADRGGGSTGSTSVS